MIGRAGRPGFDTEGTAVIMTDNKSKTHFQRLASSGLESAKSQLVLKLDEIINTEVSHGVIKNIDSAIRWMKGTLYYTQLTRRTDIPHQDMDEHLKEVCQATLNRLRSIGALEVSSRELSVRALPASRIMVRIWESVHARDRKSFCK
jgi:ATP-dependent DNA helicase HFM1/MER3